MSPALVEIWNPTETDRNTPVGCAGGCAVAVSAPANYAADPMLCHCLQVRASTVQQAVAGGSICSLRQLARATGAGDGCTACHRRLKKYIEAAREEAAQKQAAADLDQQPAAA
jgi:bacterioferritin-associated ferredoxin